MPSERKGGKNEISFKGIKDHGKKDDSRRRICILKSIVGPMILLNEL